MTQQDDDRRPFVVRAEREVMACFSKVMDLLSQHSDRAEVPSDQAEDPFSGEWTPFDVEEAHFIAIQLFEEIARKYKKIMRDHAKQIDRQLLAGLRKDGVTVPIRKAPAKDRDKKLLKDYEAALGKEHGKAARVLREFAKTHKLGSDFSVSTGQEIAKRIMLRAKVQRDRVHSKRNDILKNASPSPRGPKRSRQF